LTKLKLHFFNRFRRPRPQAISAASSDAGNSKTAALNWNWLSFGQPKKFWGKSCHAFLDYDLNPGGFRRSSSDLAENVGSPQNHLQQSVIHAVHLMQERVRSLVQKTAQRLWIGEVR
jgi:hypothetical protein